MNIGNDEIVEGLYEGSLLVNSAVKKAIEEGTAANFFHFTASVGSDSYEMSPKMPEYGSIATGSPVFKMRINNNRLVKGIANQFLTGGKPDYAKGYEFLNELDLRLGLSDNPVSLEALHSGTDSREQGLDWLATMLEIPASERNDFKNFADAMFFNQAEGRIAPYMGGNFLQIWGGFASAAMVLENESGLEALNDGSGRLSYNLEQKSKAVEELLRYADMNPETNMKLICPTECSGSLHSNRLIWEFANNADINLGNPSKAAAPGMFSVNIEARDMQSADPDKLGERKWDQHVATNIGSFTDKNGKTYQLTLEAFAPEADVFLKHPGMTDAVSIGIFENEASFRNHYYKNAHIEGGEEVARFCENKQKLKHNMLRQLDENSIFERVDAPVRSFAGYSEQAYLGLKEDFLKFSIGEEWENSRLDPGYKPVMGLSGYTTNELEYEFKLDLRNAIMLSDRVPAEYRESYNTLVDTLDRILERAGAYGKAKLNFNAISTTLEAEKGNTELLNSSYEYAAELEEKDMDMRLARIAARSLLSTALTGSAQMRAIDSNEREALLSFLNNDEKKLNELEKMAAGLNGRLMTPTQINLDIQAPEDSIATDFVMSTRIDTMSLRAKEFAVQNFDIAFSSVFSKSAIKHEDHSIFDNIYINGRAASDIFRESRMQYESAEYKKIDIMKHIIGSDQVEASIKDERNNICYVPVKPSSDINLLASRFRRNPVRENIDTAALQRERIELSSPAGIASAQLLGERSVNAPKEMLDLYGAASETLLVDGSLRDRLISENSLLNFEEKSQGKYQAALRLPEQIYGKSGEEINFRENYNYMIKGMSQMLLDEEKHISKFSANFTSDFAMRAASMFKLGKDPFNPSASKEEVRGYRDNYIAEQLEIPKEKRDGFKRFFNESDFGMDCIASAAEFAEGIKGMDSLSSKLGAAAMKAVENDLSLAERHIREISEIEPESSVKVYIPGKDSEKFLSSLSDMKPYPRAHFESISASMGNSGNEHKAFELAAEGRHIFTAELKPLNSAEHFRQAPFTSEIYFGAYYGREGFEKYHEAAPLSSPITTRNENFIIWSKADTKSNAEALMNGSTVSEFSPKGLLSSGLCHTLTLDIMQSKEEKANTGLWALEELTGAKLLGSGKTTPDMELLNSAFSKICINGEPFGAKPAVNAGNWQDKMAEFTDKLSGYMNLNSLSADNISVFTGDSYEAVAYEPNKPVKPVNNVNIFSSRSTRRKYQLDKLNYDEANAEYTGWSERNSIRREETAKYTQTLNKKKTSFEELHKQFNPFKNKQGKTLGRSKSDNTNTRDYSTRL